MSKRCPRCNAIVEFAQCDYRICNCGWEGDWTHLIDDIPVIDTINITIDEALAKAIVDMDNISFSESLGPQSESGCWKWTKLVRTVVERFNLQELRHAPERE